MIIRNSKIPKLLSVVIDAYAITLWPFVFIRDEGHPVVINHETIHLRQQKEMLIIGFYIVYSLAWFYHLMRLKNKTEAYRAIPFEKEAYANEGNIDYLDSRKF